MSALAKENLIPSEWVEIVAKQVESLKFGVVQITVHESRVVQIEKTEKVRLDRTIGGKLRWGLGLNWHLNRNIKASVNYLHTDFTGGSKVKGEVTAQDEEAIFARIQFAF